MMPLSWRLRFGPKPLPFEIIAEPTRIDMTDEMRNNPKKNFFKQIDDKKIVIEERFCAFSGWWFGTISFGMAGMFTFLFVTILPDAYEKATAPSISIWLIWLTFSSIVVPAVLLTLYSYYYGLGMLVTAVRYPKRPIIFDRLNGTVTLPPGCWGHPETVPFSKLVVTEGFASGPGGGTISYEELTAIRSDGWSIYLTLESNLGRSSYTVQRDWSFWVWYMDKHRPLPPGTAFDPYRARDLQRIAEEYEKPWSKGLVEA